MNSQSPMDVKGFFLALISGKGLWGGRGEQ